MAKGRKLTATSEFGTFTRTTHHNYKFVVVAMVTEAAHQETITRAAQYVAYLQGLIDAQTPMVIDGRRYYQASQHSSIQAEVCIVDARQRWEASKAPRTWYAANWCSRRDLAEKVAANLRKPAYQTESVYIVTVDQPTEEEL